MSEDSLSQTQNLPKMYTTIKSSREQEVAPPIELKWCNGLEDAITRLSEKVLDESVVAMTIQKSGLDCHITYRVGEAEDDSSALALVKEMEEWS